MLRRRHQGFTLPTVLIASIMMLGLLALALQLTTSANMALKEQYYNQLAREAAESGIAKARACLYRASGTVPWTNTSKLKPNTNCKGVGQASYSQYASEFGNIKTSFEVDAPASAFAATNYLLTAKGSVSLTSPSGVVFKTYTYYGTALSNVRELNQVAFGYNMFNTCPGTAFYILVDGDDNSVKGAGSNSCAQLGTGETGATGSANAPFGPNRCTSTGHSFIQMSLKPTLGIPSSERVYKVFSNFNNNARQTFVLTASGKVYGAGYNEDGELGNGQHCFRPNWAGYWDNGIRQPFLMNNAAPADRQIVYVIPVGYATYVVTSTGKIFASGYSNNGSLGIGVGDANTYRSVPEEVKLPAGEYPRLNEESWSIKDRDFDDLSGFLISESGKVYSWGDNFHGQLGMGNRNNSYFKPTQVSDFGVAGGKPKAKQVVTDGETSWILDESGTIWSSGNNVYGQNGTREQMLMSHRNWGCLTANGGSVTVGISCLGADSQMWTFTPDGSLKVRANPAAPSRLCLSSSTGPGMWENVEMTTCSNNSYQKYGSILPTNVNDGFDMNETDYTSLVNTDWYASEGNGYCVGVNSANVVRVERHCNNNDNKWWPFNHGLRKMTMPSGKKAKSISASFGSITALMEDGSVYSWGLNIGSFGHSVGTQIDKNQLINHSKYMINWDPTPFELPAGKKGVYAWNSSAGWDNFRANVFVVTEDCSVYGAGSNYFGQLGVTWVPNWLFMSPVKMQTFGSGGECAERVQSGNGTTMIFTSNDKIYTVGNNDQGQLGDGTRANKSTPYFSSAINKFRKRAFY